MVISHLPKTISAQPTPFLSSESDSKLDALSSDLKRSTFKPRRKSRLHTPPRNIYPAKICTLLSEVFDCLLETERDRFRDCKISARDFQFKELRRPGNLHKQGNTTDVQIMESAEGSSFNPTTLLVNGGIVAQNVSQTLPPKIASRMRTP